MSLRTNNSSMMLEACYNIKKITEKKRIENDLGNI